ncbi:hypothetical protein L873DRAFT_1797080 [Choiromyces venosus 120613-1]|uniref:DUF7492 domain-containing protein n=1 Tax=Choiromyces venosus 120613-1 TaxID=1336337 RepID=A0A3N4K6X8_9PEZI|nr:hypothetical protein L873DRAFT_1797080 [Choiromyces venosus 120613-1]
MHFNFINTAALLLALHAGSAVSHSWIELLEAVGPGTKGYMRSWTGRDATTDTRMTYRIEGPDWESKPICKETQQARANPPNFPHLKASRKQKVAGYYLENGHVSLPPAGNGFTGVTYWFGTNNADPKLPLREVRAWTADGKGGNKQGKLLATAPFDDGKCSQPNDSPVSKARGVGRTGVEKPCRSEFEIPTDDLKPGDVYTVYWVWDFSWHFGKDKPRVEEWYTACMDIEII